MGRSQYVLGIKLPPAVAEGLEPQAKWYGAGSARRDHGLNRRDLWPGDEAKDALGWVMGFWAGPRRQVIASDAPPARSKDSFSTCEPSCHTGSIRKVEALAASPLAQSQRGAAGGVVRPYCRTLGLPPAGPGPCWAATRPGARRPGAD
jgi:hypothetical protein